MKNSKDQSSTAVFILSCVDGEDRGSTYCLEQGSSVIIGRKPEVENGFQINDLMASRKHAKLTVMLRSVLLEDLGSANGCKVNAVDITKKTEVFPGSVISIGKSSFVLRNVGTGSHSSIGSSTSTDINELNKDNRKEARRYKTLFEMHQENIKDRKPIKEEGVQSNLFSQFMATSPMAILSYNNETGSVLAVNEKMKVLCDESFSIGSDANDVFDSLSKLLLFPKDLIVLQENTNEKKLVLETKKKTNFFSWHKKQMKQSFVFILEGAFESP